MEENYEKKPLTLIEISLPFPVRSQKFQLLSKIEVSINKKHKFNLNFLKAGR